MKKYISAAAAFITLMMISACAVQNAGTAAKAAAPAAVTVSETETPAVTAEPAVTALETTADDRMDTSSDITEDVEVIHEGAGIQMIDDDPVCFGCNEDDTGEYKNSVFIISVDADAPEESINELFEKNDLTVIYDYENFNMYAVSVPEPLNETETALFISELEKNDFILMVEPDSVVYPDSAEVQ